jgi:hypothetical protein
VQVKREEDTDLYTIITVKPWPRDLFAPSVSVIWFKHAGERDVRVCCNGGPGMSHERAFTFAQAILRAVDIAKRLVDKGAIVLEGEDGTR